MVSLPAEPVWGWVAGLIIIALLVLVLPFKVKWCEHNLEIFFLIMGILSVSISAIFSYNLWSAELVLEALKAPVVIELSAYRHLPGGPDIWSSHILL